MTVKQGERPVQVQIKEEAWKILKVYAATEGTTANKILAELAEAEAEKVREKVAAVL